MSGAEQVVSLIFVGGGWVIGYFLGRSDEKSKKPSRSRCGIAPNPYSETRCGGLADPRCEADNCTAHCNQFCGGKCRS